MKLRDLRALLRQQGARFDRQTGSHEVWRLPSGESLPPFPCTSSDVSRGVAHKVVRALRNSTKEER